MSRPNCPECGIEVGSTWRWCLACGFDPDGAQQHARAVALEARRRQGSWVPTVVVGVGLVLGGAFLWKTTPSDGSATKMTLPNTEVVWQRYSPPEGGFSVDEPNEPTPADSTFAGTGQPAKLFMTSINSHLLAVTDVDTGRTDLDGGVSNEAAAAFLREFAVTAGTTYGGKLGQTSSTWVGPAPALDFTVDDAVSGEVRGRLVLVGSHVYVVAVNGTNFDRDLADHFIGSFVLK